MASTRTKLVDSQGRAVPSISTILRKFQDPSSLLNWAWRMGAEGKSLDDARKEQTTLGHVAAARAMRLLAGEPLYDGFYLAQDLAATDKPVALFGRWASEVGAALGRENEPIVSDSYGFGGLVTTAMVSGREVVLSLKAGKGIYLEDILTVSAQAVLAGVDTAVLIRFGKDAGGFDECRTLSRGELAAGWKLFEALLMAHGRLKDAEAVLKGAA